jgi:NADH-quinone oxidoreductase subunit H
MLGLSWKLLLPASLANLVVTVLVAWWMGGGQ